MAEIRTCIDRIALPPSKSKRLALLSGAMWGPNYNLTVVFLDGDATLQQRVKDAANEWLKHVPMTFAYTTDPNAEVRITFRQRGSWSMLGRQANDLSKSEPTMNFGWLWPNSTDTEVSSVVLHEFGHALGCIHEHQHPAGGIPWNKQAVYDYYAGYPNYWSTDMVDRNIFQTYSEDLTVHTDTPDSQSIMMYPIDKRLTDGKYEVAFNSTLSAADISFIKKAYQ